MTARTRKGHKQAARFARRLPRGFAPGEPYVGQVSCGERVLSVKVHRQVQLCQVSTPLGQVSREGLVSDCSAF